MNLLIIARASHCVSGSEELISLFNPMASFNASVVAKPETCLPRLNVSGAQLSIRRVAARRVFSAPVEQEDAGA
jgi:hypothetical protein